MSDFTREIDVRTPSRDEVERIMRQAQRMRADVTRNAMVSIWAMLQRAITRKNVTKNVTRAPRHV